jgi:hypothetical protein
MQLLLRVGLRPFRSLLVSKRSCLSWRTHGLQQGRQLAVVKMRATQRDPAHCLNGNGNHSPLTVTTKGAENNAFDHGDAQSLKRWLVRDIAVVVAAFRDGLPFEPYE